MVTKKRMHKYIRMFLDSVDQNIQSINVAALNNNNADLATQIHSLKTRLRMMGMSEAAGLAEKLESLSRLEGKNGIVPKDIERFVFLIQSGSSELQNEIMDTSH